VFLQLTPVLPVQLVVPAGTILHLGVKMNLESATTAAAAMVEKTTIAIVCFILKKRFIFQLKFVKCLVQCEESLW
jgi:hypothetical protein